MFFIIVIMIIESTTSEALFIASLSHANKICNESVSGTFITTRNSISNFGFTWPSSLSFYMAGVVPWQTLSYVGLLLGVPYTMWMKKTLLNLEGKQSEEYFDKKSTNQKGFFGKEGSMIEMTEFDNSYISL
jgi:hypothetical protein